MHDSRAVPFFLSALLLAALAVGGAGTPASSRKYSIYKAWPFDAAEARRRQKETAKALGLPVERKIDLGGGVALTLVLVPAGEFLMGSPADEPGRFHNETQHRVTLAQPFWIGKCELTQSQWTALGLKNRSRFRGPGRPVDYPSWRNCRAALKALNAKVPGGGFALPTEAQWEYACRAGTATPFHFGTTLSTDQAEFNGEQPYAASPIGENRKTTQPVASYPPNAWGLHDMHGNLWEWCSSLYKPYPYKPHDGREDPTAEGDRVRRGGGWLITAQFCRSANRARSAPSYRYPTYGLRVVRRIALPSPPTPAGAEAGNAKP